MTDKKTKFALGPWKTMDDEEERVCSDFYWVYDANDNAIVDTKINPFISMNEARANARLIAKAPEMFDCQST